MVSDDFVMECRSKSALGRLGFAEVQDVLAYLESIGFGQGPSPAPMAPLPAITLAAIETALEAAFVPAPPAP